MRIVQSGGDREDRLDHAA